jgi:hypothetical protein
MARTLAVKQGEGLEAMMQRVVPGEQAAWRQGHGAKRLYTRNFAAVSVVGYLGIGGFGEGKDGAHGGKDGLWLRPAGF